MPDTIALEPGSYYVEAHSDNDLPAAFENPYYVGNSGEFTLNSDESRTVQITCSLANTIVSVAYDPALADNFTNFSTTVSTGSDSLVFEKDETRWGYFRPLPMTIRVDLTWKNPDGSDNHKILSGNIADPQSKHHYEISVNASVEKGKALLSLFLDETEIPIEVVEVGGDPVIVTEGAIGYGELLITEIMPDPSALSDTEGEWFEIYNASDHTVDLLNLVLERDDSYRHTISNDISLLPGEFIVMQRTETATAVTNHYVYGSSISLPNTGAKLAIYNESDGTTPGPLIFTVDYGNSGFSVTAGAALSLDPSHMNANEAVLGSSWCNAISVYGSGDYGTPGTINDVCP